MAATDASYRNIKTLHIVFAVSSILTLLATIGMFSEDYFREWKIEQRVYRDGQFDARSESAGPSPTSEMTPRVVLPSSLTSIASSKDDCHDPFTIVAASAGNKIAAPGGITVASS